jgi:hypothetical protein
MPFASSDGTSRAFSTGLSQGNSQRKRVQVLLTGGQVYFGDIRGQLAPVTLE